MSAGYGYPAKVLFEGHLIVLLTSVLGRYYRALVIRKVCVGDGNILCPLLHAFASAVISAWTSRCLFKYKRQCEGLKMWNDNSRFPRFFVWLDRMAKLTILITTMMATLIATACLYGSEVLTLWGGGEMRALLHTPHRLVQQVMPDGYLSPWA